jgi:hypothetical protein
MTDRERMTEILKAYTKKHNIMASSVILEEYAEELIKQGAIMPICKFEDTIYRIGGKGEIYGDWELCHIQVYPDEILYIDDSDNYFTAEDIGKTVFLTKEEAEAELQKRGVSNAENN